MRLLSRTTTLVLKHRLKKAASAVLQLHTAGSGGLPKGSRGSSFELA